MTTPTTSPPADHDTTIDTITGNLLRAGVILAAVVLLIGGGVFLIGHATEPNPDRSKKFVRMPDKYSRPAAIFEAARLGEGRPIIQIGVLLLIATPLLRVLFTAVAFAFRRDVVYVIIPLLVLAVLIIGIWTGQAE